MASTLDTSTSPTRTAVRLTRCTGTGAVGRLRDARAARCAQVQPDAFGVALARCATSVAPVSTMNCTARPLMAAGRREVPAQAGRHDDLAPRRPALARRAGQSRRRAAQAQRVAVLPPRSHLRLVVGPAAAASRRRRVWPTASVCGWPSMTSSALLPMLPASDARLCACAGRCRQWRSLRATRPSSAVQRERAVHQSRKLLKDSGRSVHFLAQQRHRRLQVVALGAADAHRVALDRGLHLELALLDQRPGSSCAASLSMPLLHRHQLLDLVAAHLLAAWR